MKNTAQNDIWQIGASIIFWPFLLLLGEEDDFKKRELADLTGRINALEEAANNKECDLSSAYWLILKFNAYCMVPPSFVRKTSQIKFMRPNGTVLVRNMKVSICYVLREHKTIFTAYFLP